LTLSLHMNLDISSKQKKWQNKSQPHLDCQM